MVEGFRSLKTWLDRTINLISDTTRSTFYEIDKIMMYATSTVDYIIKEEPWMELMDKLDGLKNARFDILENIEGANFSLIQLPLLIKSAWMTCY